MFGEKRYTMLRILSVLAKLAALLYMAHMVISWLSFNQMVGREVAPTLDVFVSAVLVSFGLFTLGYLADAAADTAENSRETVIHLRYLSEQRLPPEQRSVNGMWDEETPQGERWRNKFRGWRPEKTPLIFDDDEPLPTSRRPGVRRVQ